MIEIRFYTDEAGRSPFTKWLYELRIKHGPGYRVYYTRQNDKLIIILAGGHKGSQDRDILKCLKILKKFRGDKS